MRVLILSITAGEGHNSCAKAIKEIYDICEEPANIADGLDFVSHALKKFIAFSHIVLYRHFPAVFNFGYTQSEKKPHLFRKGSLVYKILLKGVKRLKDYIEQGDYDTVICTHPFAAIMVTEVVKQYNLRLKTAFVATDFTCSPSTKESDVDYYFIPHKSLISDFRTSTITPEKIIATGIPIRQSFYSINDKELAKTELGIDPSHRHIVMMCGSMGCGPLASLACRVSEKLNDQTDLTIICGTNKKLRRRLQRSLCGKPRVHVIGFTNNMSQLLDSADLFLTKPGGISTSEAVAKCTPMLFVNTVGACESYNLAHFLKYNVAVSGRTVKELSRTCIDLISDAEKLDEMRDNLAKMGQLNSAELIRNILL